MELIEAEPAVRVGRVVVLGGRLLVEEARLARGAAAFFAPSAIDGLGRAEVGDFRPSGEVTEERVGAVAEVGEVAFAAAVVLATGAVPAGLVPGAREALRAAVDVVDDGAGRVVDAGGGIDVLLLAVDVAAEELAALRMVVVAPGGLEVAPEVAVAFVVPAEGVALAVPEPNVLELTAC